ncbi:acetyltransferase [Vibrio sp. UCD-FRSSP16_10]|uniref:GNAT family N-acetyltransferase n=1 Tax=unclassified Vibrio TaxID=2614977 RepID=UPI00080131AF|nr:MULTISPECIES: GNAT family N-acetyltransferase [unclassified Vibrio]OBT16953.1 acetyltransferase [Vibrio sp. UCD-FRSSP16_30]OBT21944.1 acetyltransferase [Vibrio sp. UCD-FRSSP16_10]
MDLQTARLELLPLSLDDWTLFKDLYLDKQVMALCFDPLSLDELKARFHVKTQPWSCLATYWLCLVVVDKHTKQKVGITGFCLQQGVAEVGYMFLPQFYGRGYATESLDILIDWAKQVHGINHYLATVTEGNIASERVLSKVGFNLNKIIPNASFIGGKLYDDYIYHLSLK